MNVVCIKCWDDNEVVKLHLDGTNDFECSGCGETFTCAEVRERLEQMRDGWERVLNWIESAPVPADATEEKAAA